jgi:hypothetical protein
MAAAWQFNQKKITKRNFSSVIYVTTQMTRDIEPVSVYPSTATQLRVDDCLVTLDTSVNVQWSLLDAQSKQLNVGRITLSGEDYADWGSDDNYVFNKIAEQLNLTVVPAEDPEPSE